MPPSRGRFAIALGLDLSASSAVRRLSQNLKFRRLPGTVPGSPGLEPPPHITLAVCSGLDIEQFRPLAAEVAARSQTLPFTLASLGVFPTAGGVLFLAPATSADLVQLQLGVLERLHQTGTEVEPYWMPGQWVPHCTLAIGIPPETMATAVGQTLTDFHPIAGHLVRLSVYGIDPPELCYEFPLSRP